MDGLLADGRSRYRLIPRFRQRIKKLLQALYCKELSVSRTEAVLIVTFQHFGLEVQGRCITR